MAILLNLVKIYSHEAYLARSGYDMASLYPAGPVRSGYNGVTHGFYSGPYLNIKAEQIMCKDCREYILTFVACFGHQSCFCWRRLAGRH